MLLAAISRLGQSQESDDEPHHISIYCVRGSNVGGIVFNRPSLCAEEEEIKEEGIQREGGTEGRKEAFEQTDFCLQ